MNKEKILSLIAIANKARKVFSGEFMCLEQIRMGEAEIIIVASDSGKNCKKKFKNKANYYELPYLELASKAELGKMLGKGEKAVLVINDEGFKNEILKLSK